MIFPNYASSQDGVVELKNNFENAQSDSVRVELGIRLIEYYMVRDIDSVYYFLNTTEPYINKDSQEFGYYLQGLAIYYEAKKDMVKSLEIVDEAINLFKKFKNLDGYISVMTHKVRIELMMKDISEATRIIHEILDLYRQLPSTYKTESISIDYITIQGFKSYIECQAGQHNSALKSAQIAYEVAIDLDDSLRIFEAQYNLAQELIHNGQLEEGINYNKRSLHFVNRSEFYYYGGLIESTIMHLYAKLNNFDSSKVYYQKTENFLETEGDYIIDKEIIILTMGQTDLLMGNINLAVQRCKQGYNYVKENQMNMFLVDACECLKSGYEKLANPVEALKYSDELYELAKSNEAHDAEISFVLAEERVRYAENLYESKIEAQQQKFIIDKQNLKIKTNSLITTFLIVFISLMLILVVIIFYQFVKVRRQKVIVSRSYGEKIVLLKEVHHRVKNNFQVIHSLLNLHANGTENQEIRSSLHDAQNRIKAMAIVHENLYKAKNVEKIEMDAYLRSLVNHITESFDNASVVFNGEISAETISFSINESIPIGLIVNELLTNSGKYGADEQGLVTFRIELERIEGYYYLRYGDKGPGLPMNIDVNNLNSLGLELIEVLAEQIDGELTYSNEGGFNCVIKFDFNLHEHKV